MQELREFMMRSGFARPQTDQDRHWSLAGLTDHSMREFLKKAGLPNDDLTIANPGWDDMSVDQPEFITIKPYEKLA
jgi:hypothetical protein